jgi:protein-L-isoaspartate(D-aspartate) O-methyltransferase
MRGRSENLRNFFADYVSATAGARDPRITEAFAAVEREPFAGPGPWSVHVAGSGYIETPNADPAFLYQDTLVALDATRGINIGQPSAHAQWLDALGLVAGETVLQVGAGSGYYTAIIAHLVGPHGRVHAFEVDPVLAGRARDNLREVPQATLHARSGIAAELPKVDAIYVCAGITQPSWTWLDALHPGGRLLFPLQPEGGFGGMLLIKRAELGPIWPARFVSRAGFIACSGSQDSDAGRRLATAFSDHGNHRWHQVRSFRLDEPPDDTCWYSGDGWWLSTARASGRDDSNLQNGP